jgi:hypothetical protein
MHIGPQGVDQEHTEAWRTQPHLIMGEELV